VGTGHAVNGETGALLGPNKMPLRSLTQGRWISEKCDAASNEEDDTEDDTPPPAPPKKPHKH
jgi:hypothetical protein